MTTESKGVGFAEALEKAGIGKSALGRELGLSPQTIHNWERRGVSSRYALTVARLLNCSPSAISDVAGDELSSAVIDAEVLSVAAMTEGGKPLERRALDGRFLSQPPDDGLAVVVETGAMSPALEPGDVAIVYRGDRPLPGDIVAASTPGGAIVLRRYREVDGETFQLVPLSDDWATITIRDGDGYVVLGVARVKITAL